MPEIIRGIEQNSPEWWELRNGSIGGSSVPAIIAKGKGKAESKMRRSLRYSLAAEILTGVRDETYSNKYMDRGHTFEPKAREYYELINDVEVEQIAMIKSNLPRVHVSPDGLIGEDGGLEIKTLMPHIFVELLDTGIIDGYHIKQCQHFLSVSGRKWIDYMAYCSEMPDPSWIKRLYRDEEMISLLESEIMVFLKELDELLERLK